MVGKTVDTDPANYPSWRTIFRLFADLANDEPLVIVLDEFQYLMAKEDDVVSHLVAVWDRELRGRPLMLVLCGSEVATMERLEAGDGPLYGRWNWAARLRPFDYLDAAAMVPDREPREAALVYGIFGGTPRFLATIQPGESLAERVIESVLSPRGEVHLQLDRIIEQEKGIREPAEYRALLAAIAGGKTVLEEIVQAAAHGRCGASESNRCSTTTWERSSSVSAGKPISATTRRGGSLAPSNGRGGKGRTATSDRSRSTLWRVSMMAACSPPK